MYWCALRRSLTRGMNREVSAVNNLRLSSKICSISGFPVCCNNSPFRILLILSAVYNFNMVLSKASGDSNPDALNMSKLFVEFAFRLHRQLFLEQDGVYNGACEAYYNNDQ